jgi:hypothetical protein
MEYFEYKYLFDREKLAEFIKYFDVLHKNRFLSSSTIVVLGEGGKSRDFYLNLAATSNTRLLFYAPYAPFPLSLLAPFISMYGGAILVNDVMDSFNSIANIISQSTATIFFISKDQINNPSIRLVLNERTLFKFNPFTIPGVHFSYTFYDDVFDDKTLGIFIYGKLIPDDIIGEIKAVSEIHGDKLD